MTSGDALLAPREACPAQPTCPSVSAPLNAYRAPAPAQTEGSHKSGLCPRGSGSGGDHVSAEQVTTHMACQGEPGGVCVGE